LEGSQEKRPLGQGEGWPEVVWEIKEVQETWKISQYGMSSGQFLLGKSAGKC